MQFHNQWLNKKNALHIIFKHLLPLQLEKLILHIT